MARIRKTSLNPCEEFKKVNMKNLSAGANAAESASEALNSRPPRIKTLTRAAKSEFPRVKAELKNILPTLTAVEVRRLYENAVPVFRVHKQILKNYLKKN